MRNVVTTRNWIIVTLCITIVFMAIGFAILSMQLDEKGNSKAVHDTSFVTINPRTPVQGGTKVPSSTASITNSGQTINFEFQLYAPSDEISYRITIKNQGTIDAEIINLVEYPDYLNNAASAQSIYPVEVKHNNIIGKVLSPGEETELNVAATFNYNGQAMPIKVPYQITIITKSPNT
ncbi:MAG: hypothetical protein UE699_01420 [Bacilli bacterium]|nr:hypothetical protein [Mycoplasmatota bacterium]MDD6263768.1 hypothetical protein [bacterium]MDY2697842.1 hypothetical protein [Bacilli bacterium]MDD6941372.1 hypothetical protein [bacterium]MDY5993542.1 hypothetical protein [Bacilli bacterium]